MTMLLELLERHRARHLFRSSHLKREGKQKGLKTFASKALFVQTSSL